MAQNVVEFEIRDQIALVRLNRPEVHNAIDRNVMDLLEEILAKLYDRPEILVVILTGAGRESFCAGGDIKYFATLKTREDALAMSRRMQAILNTLFSGNKVVIAAVNGRALGGGCELLTACHFRLAAEHATFSFRQAANGVITGWGGGVRLFRLLGHNHALQLFLTSETIDAREAHRIHFVDRVLPAEDLLPAAFKLAKKITENSSAAVRGFLRIARKIQLCQIDELVNDETEQFADLWIGEDFKNWLNGFLLKQ
ncbi:hypothetical protein B1H10_07110 [candidate division KSB1 bacterium 4484_188]|nr:MAG: hypothetical protein B1H10_07110 [candidate division KSB1 bacterium 4484_188]